MDFSLNDHQKLIRDTVRQFMEAEVRPFVKEWEKAEKFPAEAIKKLGEMGCCGMQVPEEWGGPGLDTISYAVFCLKKKKDGGRRREPDRPHRAQLDNPLPPRRDLSAGLRRRRRT